MPLEPLTSPPGRPLRHSVTFIVPVRNDAVSLKRCLQSIIRSGNAYDQQLIVLDNGSTDDSASVARELGALVLQLPGLKVGELRNRGAGAASSDVLAFVDADHEIGPGWTAAALETIGRPGVAAVGAQYWNPDQSTWVQRIYNAFRRHPEGVCDADWLGAGNLLVRSEAFSRVGGFDTRLEACEDVDLCQRLKQAGYHLVSDSRLRSVHYGDPASLGALWRAELWRGRDNLRVSLRGPLSPGSLPSIVIPVVDLISVAVVAGATVARAPVPAAIAVAVFLGLAALRSFLVFQRLADRTGPDLLRTFIVTVVYDLGRALALVARVPHRRARRASQAVSL